jgi:hypothetical protein
MKTLKGIALLVGFCAIGVGMFLFVVLGMLCLALRDGFFAAVGGIRRRLRGESKLRNEPKIFYGGRDGVPNLVMDADGFVEPPAALGSPRRLLLGVEHAGRPSRSRWQSSLHGYQLGTAMAPWCGGGGSGAS